MAVTLAQAQLNCTDDVQIGVIDEFRKSGWLFNNLIFDDCVSPVGGGGTLTYGYTRLVTQPTAAGRAINSEYTPSEVEKQRFTTDLKVFGGSYQIDRVLTNLKGIVDEVALQASQKIKATKATFSDMIINGNESADALTFDGLEVALTGSDTEYNAAGTTVDLSTSANVTANYVEFLDKLDEFMLTLDGEPSALLMNTKMLAKMRAVARRNGMYQVKQNEFGQQVEYYGNIPMVDLGAKAGSNDPIVGIDENGETSIYAIRIGLDGFHALSLSGVAPIQTWLPDFKTAGAVKTGEVEMIAGCALKATKAAGVFRKIKVQ